MSNYHPIFALTQIRDSTQTSLICIQARGLRQGCPLPTYIFRFVLTHRLKILETKGESTQGLVFRSSAWLLFFIGLGVEKLRHIMQKTGARRGLYFSFDKCHHLQVSFNNGVNFDRFSLPLSKTFGFGPCCCRGSQISTSLSWP